ncbi:MAG: hypothetical protein SGPRY_004531, partial [Prymnesium sp.]
FRNYDASITSATQNAARERARAEEKRDPTCCCCKATDVLIASNTVLFFFSIAIMIIGFFINNEVSGWSLNLVDILGSLIIATGVFLFVLSILGIMAARTTTMTLMFSYFLLTLLLVSTLCLSVVYAVVEADDIRVYLQKNWDRIQLVLCGPEESARCNAPEFDDVNKMLQDYFYIFVGVGFAALATQFLTLFWYAHSPVLALPQTTYQQTPSVAIQLPSLVGSAMRMLGVRAIAISCLVTLGILGIAEVGVAILTAGQVNRPTTWLLFACAGVQVTCALTGICGFKNLNRSCLEWAFLVLLISSGGLVYVVVTSYAWLKEGGRQAYLVGFACQQHPEHILLLFGISITSAFFMFSSLLFGAIFYCKRRSAFQEADRACEIHGQFSETANMRRPRRGGRPREYCARGAL